MIITDLLLGQTPPTGWIVHLKFQASFVLLILLIPSARRIVPMFRDRRPGPHLPLWDEEIDRREAQTVAESVISGDQIAPIVRA